MKKNRDEPTIDDEMSYNFATQTAAVFRTYGSSSRKHFRNGSHKYSVILSTRMHPMVRTAKARINGFESSQSYYNNKRKDKNGKNLDFAVIHLLVFLVVLISKCAKKRNIYF